MLDQLPDYQITQLPDSDIGAPAAALRGIVALLQSNLRADAFFVGDPGIKLIAAKNAIARPDHPLDIPLPVIGRESLPYVEPFFEVHDDHAHAVTTDLFPLVSAPLHSLVRPARRLPAAGARFSRHPGRLRLARGRIGPSAKSRSRRADCRARHAIPVLRARVLGTRPCRRAGGKRNGDVRHGARRAEERQPRSRLAPGSRLASRFSCGPSWRGGFLPSSRRGRSRGRAPAKAATARGCSALPWPVSRSRWRRSRFIR